MGLDMLWTGASGLPNPVEFILDGTRLVGLCFEPAALHLKRIAAHVTAVG